MSIKIIICIIICVSLFLFVYLTTLEYREFGSVSPPAPICSLAFFIWLVIVLAIPAERFERKKRKRKLKCSASTPKLKTEIRLT